MRSLQSGTTDTTYRFNTLSTDALRSSIDIYRGAALQYSNIKPVRFRIEEQATSNLPKFNIRIVDTPSKSIQEGDLIEFYNGLSGQTLKRRFMGEVRDVSEVSLGDSELKELNGRNVGLVLLENEKTQEWTDGDVEDIVDDIITPVQASSPDRSQRKIDYNKEVLDKTVTFSVKGENLFHSLRDLAEDTDCDFYVDGGKTLQFFNVGSRSMSGSITNYNVVSFTEEINDTSNIVNTVDVYGSEEGYYPSDKDWCESCTNFSDLGSAGENIILTRCNPSWLKAGNSLIVNYVKNSPSTWSVNSFKFTFPSQMDFTTKESYKYLNFAFIGRTSEWLEDSTLRLYLIDSSSNTLSYPLENKYERWLAHEGWDAPNLHEYRIELGENAQIDGEWSTLNPSFNWDSVTDAGWESKIYYSNLNQASWLALDWLHLSHGKYKYSYGDNTSMTSYGTVKKEIFDETLTSTKRCSLKAEGYVTRYKDPIDRIDNVNLSPGMYSLSPGDYVDTSDFSVSGSTLRVDKIEHTYSNGQYIIKPSFTPITPKKISGDIRDIEKRVGSLEQRED